MSSQEFFSSQKKLSDDSLCIPGKLKSFIDSSKFWQLVEDLFGRRGSNRFIYFVDEFVQCKILFSSKVVNIFLPKFNKMLESIVIQSFFSSH